MGDSDAEPRLGLKNGTPYDRIPCVRPQSRQLRISLLYNLSATAADTEMSMLRIEPMNAVAQPRESKA
jgi:hypothetical protein